MGQIEMICHFLLRVTEKALELRANNFEEVMKEMVEKLISQLVLSMQWYNYN